MSGHSKWATTKRAKAVVDAKRGVAFTKLAKNITVAAREGGNPESNYKLAAAIEKARAVSMPKENIDRAIKKGTGELAGEIIESVTYEGFAPGGSPVIVECLTDNRNRAAQSIKAIFSKNGGTLGNSGSVSYLFSRLGVIRLSKNTALDEMVLIEMGVDDILVDDEGLTLLVATEKLSQVKQLLLEAKVEIESADLTWWPKNAEKFPESEAGEKLGNFLSALEDDDDVDEVITSCVL